MTPQIDQLALVCMRSYSKEHTEPTERLGSVCIVIPPKCNFISKCKLYWPILAVILEVTATVTNLIRGL